MTMPSRRHGAKAPATDRVKLERLFFELQRERLALTGTIMRLRGEGASQRPRVVLEILVALLRLQRANRRATVALDRAAPK